MYMSSSDFASAVLLCLVFYWLLLSKDARQARLLKAEAKSLLLTKSIDIAQELLSVRTPVWKTPVEDFFFPELETRPSISAVAKCCPQPEVGRPGSHYCSGLFRVSY